MMRIRQNPFAFYLLFAFAFCWVFWVPRAMLSHLTGIPEFVLITLQIFGAFGPATAAIVVQLFTGGWPSVRKMFSLYQHWRVGAGWYLLVLAYRPLIWAAALGLYLAMGWKDVSSKTVDWGFFTAYLLSQLLIVGVGEELGWMGFAYPWLRGRYTYWVSGLVLGLIWSFWHLPMFFTVGDSQFGSSFLLFALKLTVLRFVFALAFEATGSLLMPALFHVSMNVLTELVPLSPNDPLAILLLVVVTAGLLFSPILLKRAPVWENHSREWLPDSHRRAA